MTARARGLPERRVILKYPVRVALNPFASTVGYLLPYVVSGSIIVSLVLEPAHRGPAAPARRWWPRTCSWPGRSCCCSGVLTVVGTFLSDLLLHVDRSAHPPGGPAIAECRPQPGVAEPPSARRGRAGEPVGPGRPRSARCRGAGLRRHPVAAHVVALPPPPAGHGGHGDRAALLPGRGLRRLPGLLPTHGLRGAALAPASAADHWFDDGRFAPHVYGLVGQARPVTFKRVYTPDPARKIPVTLLRPGLRVPAVRADPDRPPPPRRRGRASRRRRSSSWAPTSRGAICGRGSCTRRRTSLTIGLAGVALEPRARA